ncbi:MAG: hypothetical protein N3D20_00270 [Candidatus Pacearchaeota archaeon]|nr:hypothetical protein [Candidatus Pacearchaeota archaeon]
MKREVFFIGFVIFIITFASAICNDENQVILRLYRENNSHAAIWSNTTYSEKVCFNDIFGLNYSGTNPHDCNSDNSNVVLKLNQEFNAHAALPTLPDSVVGFPIKVCYKGVKKCELFDNDNCRANQKAILYFNSVINSHLSKNYGGDFTKTLCCYRYDAIIHPEWCFANNISSCDRYNSQTNCTQDLCNASLVDPNCPLGATCNCAWENNQCKLKVITTPPAPPFCSTINSCGDYKEQSKCSEDMCNVSGTGYKCEWNIADGKCEKVQIPGWCSVISSCSNYTTQANCSANPCLEGKACYWNNSVCKDYKADDKCRINNITKCANYVDKDPCNDDACNVSIIGCSPNQLCWCAWENNKCEKREKDREEKRDFCDYIDSCSDYDTSNKCENDNCGIADYDENCPIGRDCSCKWISNVGCGVSFESGGGSGGRMPPGSGGWGNPGCKYNCTINTKQGECKEGFMDVIVNAETRIIQGCTGATGSPLDCQTKTIKGVPCALAETELPFFEFWQILISIVGIVFVYLFLLKNWEKIKKHI